jgi:hypothetical protein
MDDPPLRAALGERARADVGQRFDRRKNIQDLVSILDPSAARGGPGAKGLLQFARS